MDRPTEQRLHFPQGEILFAEGEPGDFFYFIKKGRIAIYRGYQKDEILLGVVEELQPLGEMAVLDGSKRSATAVALTEIEAIKITQEEVNQQLEDCPPWFQVIVKTIVDRLRKTDEIFQRNRVRDPALSKLLNGYVIEPEHRTDPPKESEDEDQEKKKLIFKRGEVVLKEGDLGAFFYLVKRGRLGVFKDYENDKIPIAEVRELQAIGEMAIVDGRGRSATIVAITEVEVLKITKATFDAQLANRNPWFRIIIKTLVKRLRRIDEIFNRNQIHDQEYSDILSAVYNEDVFKFSSRGMTDLDDTPTKVSGKGRDTQDRTKVHVKDPGGDDSDSTETVLSGEDGDLQDQTETEAKDPGGDDSDSTENVLSGEDGDLQDQTKTEVKDPGGDDSDSTETVVSGEDGDLRDRTKTVVKDKKRRVPDAREVKDNGGPDRAARDITRLGSDGPDKALNDEKIVVKDKNSDGAAEKSPKKKEMKDKKPPAKMFHAIATLIVVDSDVEFVQTLTEIFEALSVRIVSCKSGDEARMKLRNQKFECLVINMHLEWGSAKTVIHHTRGLKSNPNNGVPIIVIGEKKDERQIQDVKSQVNLIMMEPLNAHEVVEKVKLLALSKVLGK